MLDSTANRGGLPVNEGYAVDFGAVDVTPRARPVARSLAPPPSLAQIKRAQDHLAQFPQVEMPVRHFFSPGQYTRECTIPAGSIVVGKMHRHQHPTFLLKGTARINTDRGMETISAPHIWISQPGAKRILLTISECVFATVHLNPSDTQDLDAIEAEVIVPEDAIDYDTPQLAEFADALQEVYA